MPKWLAAVLVSLSLLAIGAGHGHQREGQRGGGGGSSEPADAGTESLLAGLADAGACPIIIVGAASQSLSVGTCNAADSGTCVAQTTANNGIDFRINSNNTAIVAATENVGSWGNLEYPVGGTVQQWRAMHNDGGLDSPLLPIFATSPGIGGSGLADWRCTNDAGVYLDAGNHCHEAFFADIYAIQRLIAAGADAGTYPCTHGVVVAWTQEFHGNADPTMAQAEYTQRLEDIDNNGFNMIRLAEADAGVPVQTYRPRVYVKPIATWIEGANTTPSVPIAQQAFVEAADAGPRYMVGESYAGNYERIVGVHMQSPSYQKYANKAGRGIYRNLELGTTPSLYPTAASVDGTDPTIIHLDFAVPVPPLVLDAVTCDNTHTLGNNYGLEFFQNEAGPPVISSVAVDGSGTRLNLTMDRAVRNYSGKLLRNAYTGVGSNTAPWTEPACNEPDFPHSNIADSDTYDLRGGSTDEANRAGPFRISLTGGQTPPASDSAGYFRWDDDTERVNIADNAAIECGAGCMMQFWVRRSQLVNNQRLIWKSGSLQLLISTASGGGLTVQLDGTTWAAANVNTTTWVTLNDWISVTFRYNGAITNDARVYFDCVKNPQSTPSGSWVASLANNTNAMTLNEALGDVIDMSHFVFWQGTFDDDDVNDVCWVPMDAADYNALPVGTPTVLLKPDGDDVCTSGSANITNYGSASLTITTTNMESGDCVVGGGP